jgi:catechol 2,3-dioxygenase-like lactoylglutathione lyase family enzyme
MLDHISIQCSDLTASTRFYDSVLGAIGAGRILAFADRVGYGIKFPSFWIGPLETGVGFRESHIAFAADSRESVIAFQQAAVAVGAEVLHTAKDWPEYHPGYFGAFVRDPDGNNVEAVHHAWPK